jgi:hypothetical protein
MSMNRTSLALQAAKAALRVRQRLHISTTSPVCVWDAAKDLGITTWLVDVPSLEGMYIQGTPATILVGARRPTGRQAMTCAHEIGHHTFQHGSQIDEYLASDKAEGRTPEEFLANTFAANFLMTKSAVAQGLLARGIASSQATPEQIYGLATWLGVSYAGLLYHMRSALQIIARSVADRLLKVEPREIRAGLANHLGLRNVPGEIIIADQSWTGRPIDAQVGDVVCVPAGASFDDFCGRLDGAIITPTTPGIGRVYHKALRWAAFLRVSRQHFAGLAEYRHLEEPDDEPTDRVAKPTGSGAIDRDAIDNLAPTDAL